MGLISVELLQWIDLQVLRKVSIHAISILNADR